VAGVTLKDQNRSSYTKERTMGVP